MGSTIRRWILGLMVATWASLAMAVGSAEAAPAVELALIIDISSTIDDEEYDLQMQAYEAAFRSTEVKEAIDATGGDGIRVTLVFFKDDQTQVVPWTLVTNDQECEALADTIAAVVRPPGSGTLISNAIDFTVGLFQFDAPLQVIDLSGDGEQYLGVDPDQDVRDARDAALAAGVDRINGLAILDEDWDVDGYSDLNEYYTENLIGGDGAFSIPVESFDDFEEALIGKIVREIAPPAADLIWRFVIGNPKCFAYVFGRIYGPEASPDDGRTQGRAGEGQEKLGFGIARIRRGKLYGVVLNWRRPWVVFVTGEYDEDQDGLILNFPEDDTLWTFDEDNHALTSGSSAPPAAP